MITLGRINDATHNGGVFDRVRDRLRPRPAPAVLPPRDIASLAELHGYFVEQVNEAVAEGRDDCIAGLVAAYWHEAEHAVNSGALDWDTRR